MTSKDGTGASGSSGFTLPKPPASNSGLNFDFSSLTGLGTTDKEKAGASSGASSGFGNWSFPGITGTGGGAGAGAGASSGASSGLGNWSFLSTPGTGLWNSGAASSGFNISFGASYKFNFGTGKEFTGTTDPKTPFEGPASALAGGLGAAPAPTQPQDDSGERSSVQDLGEDGEERLLQVKGILYELADVADEKGNTKKQYVERGRSAFLVNKAKTFHRVLMRREHTGRGVLNMRVWNGMNVKAQENRVTFMGVNDVGEEVEGKEEEKKEEENKEEEKKVKIFLLKVKSKEDAEKIKEVLDEAIKSA